MEELIIYSSRIVLILIIGIIIAKIVILKTGKPISHSFSSFFWFSRWQIFNSTYEYSKRKRKILNYLTLAILGIILLEMGILLFTLWEGA